jgi:hypothetical protein
MPQKTALVARSRTLGEELFGDIRDMTDAAAERAHIDIALQTADRLKYEAFRNALQAWGRRLYVVLREKLKQHVLVRMRTPPRIRLDKAVSWAERRVGTALVRALASHKYVFRRTDTQEVLNPALFPAIWDYRHAIFPAFRDGKDPCYEPGLSRLQREADEELNSVEEVEHEMIYPDLDWYCQLGAYWMCGASRGLGEWDDYSPDWRAPEWWLLVERGRLQHPVGDAYVSSRMSDLVGVTVQEAVVNARQDAIRFVRSELGTRSMSVPIYRSKTKGAIARALSRKPTATDLELCGILDAITKEMPRPWQKAGNRTWESAYKDPDLRKKIHREVSRVRSDLRSAGVLK